MTEELTKTCPVLGCKERVAYEHFACRQHWYELPANLRSKVYHAYRHRVATGEVKRHVEAVAICLAWYREHGYGLQ